MKYSSPLVLDDTNSSKPTRTKCITFSCGDGDGGGSYSCGFTFSCNNGGFTCQVSFNT